MTPAFLPTRADGMERLDEMHHDPRELRLNIHHLAGVNRWLGGERSIMAHVRRYVGTSSGEVTRVVDVGTGGAGLPHNIAKFFTRSSLQAVVYALDRQFAVASIASERTNGASRIRIVVADGMSIPMPDDAVDLAISSTTLHHLSTEDAVRFVGELARVGRKLVIVGDLDRNALALVSAHVLARTWWRRSSYRFDGPLSVRKAFTRSELLQVGTEAGLRSPKVHRHFPFRLALVGSPS